MRNDPSVLDLVERARSGDQAAWDGIVERYATLVWSGCRRYRLAGADADDVGANVWLRLVEHLGSIRDPAALPGWLATTTRNECVRLLRDKQRQIPVDDERLSDTATTAAGSDDWLLTEERHLALRTAFAALSKRCVTLLSMLFAEPPTAYADISDRLGIPVGSIGPTRLRCLAALRSHPMLAALGEHPDQEPAEAAT